MRQRKVKVVETRPPLDQVEISKISKTVQGIAKLGLMLANGEELTLNGARMYNGMPGFFQITGNSTDNSGSVKVQARLYEDNENNSFSGTAILYSES